MELQDRFKGDDSEARWEEAVTLAFKWFIGFIVVSVLIAILQNTAHATPIVYDMTGEKTSDGKGTLYGSYIYDPASNIFHDWDLGAKYPQAPSMNPEVKIALIDRFVTLSATGQSQWVNADTLVRFGAASFEGTMHITGPIFDFGKNEFGWEWRPYFSPAFKTLQVVTVPEPGSLWFLISALPLWAGYKYLPKLRRANS